MDAAEPRRPAPQVLVGIVPTFAEAYPELMPQLELLGCCVSERLSAVALQPHELMELLLDVDVFISGFSIVTDEVLRRCNRLKLIVKFGAGFDDIDLQAASARGVMVTNAPGANARSVAEMTMTLILALARNVCRLDRMVKAGQYEQVLGDELAGKCLGLIGAGRIGRLVGGLGEAFGMTVMAYDEVVPENPPFPYVSLWELLHTADFVSVHTPLTPQTFHLIGEQELRSMKPAAYLINTSRGGVVDEGALFQAIRRGIVHGAALDVYEREPPGSSSLIALDQVVSTPHLGGATRQAAQRIGEVTVRAIEAFLHGERPANVVNPEVFLAGGGLLG